MGFISGLIIGVVVGVIFAQLLLKAFNIGWKKLDKTLDDINK